MRLGGATGRVLARELYHVVLQTTAHSRTGIAKAIHTRFSALALAAV